ncbi:similar to Saccharomyces cerevisiae YPR148C Protein of unknown function that may interact with ribosomes, based on co-purification experiments [Maudiozyma saulgeensis]|uniref:BAR domain-containing protein n=1 Tax=Maudiozyma saulgeensis TaxID=1789683 RepID=A0A1X7QX66_9SACH|nr:similar to Saccharomyces cerevisiae YPR148C Protein of unknown function that may interact with ribosomes, based on co-purification experiments [Kazachstania saulgeensis]
MFANFSLDKLTTSISTAAQQVEESLKNNSYLPSEVSNNLTFKKTSRFFQEKVGTISEQEISKLPESYTSLEKKTDQLVKILKRIIIVTKTYEIDGYDYPPNLTESLNDWWSSQQQQQTSEKQDLQFSKSFASAISKSAYESEELLKSLRKSKTVTKKSNDNNEDETEETADEVEEEEEDDEINNLIEIFNSWCKCFQEIDKNKINMDSIMIKEFNVNLEKMIQVDYKNVMTLRNKVNDSRLEFDTIRHDIKTKEASASAAAEQQATTKTSSSDETQKEQEDSKKEPTESKKESDKTAEEEDPTESEDYKLLEKLEDEFVSNTTEAAEGMMEFTNNAEIIKLIKLFQKTQLDYYKKCTEELEKNMKLLDEFDIADSNATV